MWQNHNCQRLQFLLLFLFIGFNLLVPLTAGAGMITGTVLSLDREQNTFTLSITSEKPGHKIQKTKVFYSNASLPQQLKVGKKVRIWGDYKSGTVIFKATDIRGPGRNPHYDPTGVRSRIGKGKGKKKDTQCTSSFSPDQSRLSETDEQPSGSNNNGDENGSGDGNDGGSGGGDSGGGGGGGGGNGGGGDGGGGGGGGGGGNGGGGGGGDGGGR